MSDLRYGPQTEHVEALLERVRTLDAGEMSALGAAWEAVPDAAWEAVPDAAWKAAADAALDVALHRTIDAQLGILRAARVVYGSGIAVPEWMTLADAILGGGS